MSNNRSKIYGLYMIYDKDNNAVQWDKDDNFKNDAQSYGLSQR